MTGINARVADIAEAEAFLAAGTLAEPDGLAALGCESSAGASRSLSKVKIRALSFFNSRSFFRPSVCPMDIWKRRRNICSWISRC